MDLAHEQRLSKTEVMSEENRKRIIDLENRQDNLDKLVVSVERLALREENVEKDVKEIKDDVKSLTGKSGQRWDSLVDKIIITVAAAVIGYVLAQLGLQ